MFPRVCPLTDFLIRTLSHENHPWRENRGRPMRENEKPKISEDYLNYILNSKTLDDATKAWEVAVASIGVDMPAYVAARTELLEKQKATDPHTLAAEEMAEYRKLKARQSAERRLAGEQYSGSEEMTWDDLESAQATFIVQDLLPEDGIAFLVARPNLGKTFAYLDMVLSCAAGRRWLGKETKQVKTTIVLGEGHNGFIDRIRAWCEDRGVSLEDVKPWLTFIRGANINNDESLQRVKDVVDRHGSELVIWDTYAATSGVFKEDDAALNSNTMNRATGIRPGTTHLFVHHPRKSDEDSDHPVMRGSGALSGRADVVMTMFRDRKFNAPGSVSQEWLAISTDVDHAGKNRHAENETVRGLWVDESGDSAVFRQLELESLSRESKALTMILRREMLSIEKIRDALGKSQATTYRYLKTAEAEGIIGRSDGLFYVLDPQPDTTSARDAVLDRNNV